MNDGWGMRAQSPGEAPLDAAALGRRLEPVEGWLYPNEAWGLYERARTAALRKKDGAPATIVEIGSWKGRSTVAVGLGVIAGGGNAKISAIDPHMPVTQEHVAEYGDVDTYREFIDNITAAGVSPWIEPMRMTSAEAAARFAPGTIDFLFVDGSHEYVHVKDDVTRYVPLLRDEAAIAFNDPSRAGVYRTLREEVLRNQAFRDPDLIENTLFFEFRRTMPLAKADRAKMARLRSVLRARYAMSLVRPFMPMWFVRLGHRASRKLVG